MKIRSCFVSNSSASSFLIYGALLSPDKMKDKNLQSLYNEGFDTYNMDYSSETYIGMSWDSIADDETGLQFKTNVEQKLKAVFGEDVKCMTYEEAWYDG